MNPIDRFKETPFDEQWNRRLKTTLSLYYYHYDYNYYCYFSVHAFFSLIFNLFTLSDEIKFWLYKCYYLLVFSAIFFQYTLLLSYELRQKKNTERFITISWCIIFFYFSRPIKACASCAHSFNTFDGNSVKWNNHMCNMSKVLKIEKKYIKE